MTGIQALIGLVYALVRVRRPEQWDFKMDAPAPRLMRCQFMRGLSSGVIVLAITGALCLFFATWCALCVKLGLDPLTSSAGDVDFPILWLLANAAATAFIVLGGIRVRRKAARFQRADVQSASETHRQVTRSIRNRFLGTLAGEWVAITAAILLSVHYGRTDLIWPAVALVISLHFVPLAYIFRVRSYYFTAGTGALLSILSLITPRQLLPAAEKLLLVSMGLGAALWLTAAYLIFRADNLARRWED